MSATIRGLTIKFWGTTPLSGYIVADEELVDNGGYFPIEGETGDFVTDVSNFGKYTDATVNMIPLSTAAKPVSGAAFICPDGTAIIVRSVQTMRSRKNPEMWKVSGVNYPLITP